MKSIVVHIGLDNGQEARYRVAVDIARAFDGHLTCIQPATPVDAYMPIDPFGGAAFIGDAFEKAREVEDEQRREVEARLAKEGIGYEEAARRTAI